MQRLQDIVFKRVVEENVGFIENQLRNRSLVHHERLHVTLAQRLLHKLHVIESEKENAVERFRRSNDHIRKYTTLDRFGFSNQNG